MDDHPDAGFGGDWSLEKLDCLEDYLKAFVKALRDRFRMLMYVDAFAGKGWHRVRHATKPISTDGAHHVVAQGSAMRAMRPENRFDIYRFNDLDSQHARELRDFMEQARKRLLPPPLTREWNRLMPIRSYLMWPRSSRRHDHAISPVPSQCLIPSGCR
jgi:hypothetical protein